MRFLTLYLAALMLTSPAAAVTDAERVQVYHEFRTAFDARRYTEAMPLAQKLVAMTEEQYGDHDRALINPLSNLGTTQYRLHDYSTAENTFLRCVKIVERSSGGGADRALLRPLHGLGATYFATKQYEDASLILKRALDLSRNLDGLFNVEQISILNPLIDSLIALDRQDEVERSLDYAVRVAESAYGKSDLHVIRPLVRSARWQEKMRHYPAARVLYARALQIAEDAGGTASIQSVDPLLGIGRTYRLEYVGGEAARQGAANPDDPLAAGNDIDPLGTNSPQLNPDGERAILLALKAINKGQPIDHTRRGVALVELGDWYSSSGAPDMGLKSYAEAWRELAVGGSTALLSTPRQLAYRPPMASVSRTKSDEHDGTEEHFVEVSFSVTKDGKVTDVSVADTNATESQQRSVISAIRKARYAPRFDDGRAVDTPQVRFRERLLSKKPRQSQ